VFKYNEHNKHEIVFKYNEHNIHKIVFKYNEHNKHKISTWRHPLFLKKYGKMYVFGIIPTS
jgi:hypothetical protein